MEDAPASTTALLDGSGSSLWPASDVFSDDTFGTCRTGDPRLCKRPRGESVDDHIRLVRISPVRSNGVICCETRVFRLGTPEQYTALSYTWGSPLAQRPIFLDGRPHLVPHGLWRFLEQAGDLGKQLPAYRWLWIDALSIDQRSRYERSYQVSIMASIFLTAEHVIVWLGPAYGNSGMAMEALSASVLCPQHLRNRSSIWTSPADSAFAGLCERPYWRRLWVFQELRAGRDIHLMCGSDIVPCGAAHSELWLFFCGFISEDGTGARLPRRGSVAEAVRGSAAFDMIRHIFFSSLDRVQTTLWTLLASTRQLRCTDARDRVYALLSMSTSGHQGISVDYKLPVQCLLNRILRNWHLYLRPSSLDEVSRQCILLEDTFSLDRNSMHGLFSSGMSGPGSLPDHLGSVESRSRYYEYTQSWAEFYGHTEVCRLLREATDLKRFSLEHEIPSSQHLKSTNLVVLQPESPHDQMSLSEVGSESAHRMACFLAFGTWAQNVVSRCLAKKDIQNHEP
jgi:hypothetical protein